MLAQNQMFLSLFSRKALFLASFCIIAPAAADLCAADDDLAANMKPQATVVEYTPGSLLAHMQAHFLSKEGGCLSQDELLCIYQSIPIEIRSDEITQSDNSETSLHLAIDRGLTELIAAMLKDVQNLEAPDAEGNTPLLRSAILPENPSEELLGSRIVCTKALLKAGANSKATNKHGKNLLTLLCENAFYELVETCREREIPYQTRYESFEYIEDLNADDRVVLITLKCMLFYYGKSIPAKEKRHVARELDKWHIENDDELTKFLCNLIEMLINEIAPQNNQLAVELNHRLDEEQILATLANMEPGNPELTMPFGLYGACPLVEAARLGYFQVMSRLLELGVDINAKDDIGCTALMAATAYLGELDIHLENLKDLQGQALAAITTLLKQQNCNPLQADNNNKNFLHYSAWYNIPKVVELHKLHQSSKNALSTLFPYPLMSCAAYNGHVEMCKYLHEGGAPVDSTSGTYNGPLLRVFHRLTECNNSTLRKKLIATLHYLMNEANARIDFIDANGNTCMHYAAHANVPEAIQYFLPDLVHLCTQVNGTQTPPIGAAIEQNNRAFIQACLTYYPNEFKIDEILLQLIEHTINFSREDSNTHDYTLLMELLIQEATKRGQNPLDLIKDDDITDSFILGLLSYFEPTNEFLVGEDRTEVLQKAFQALEPLKDKTYWKPYCTVVHRQRRIVLAKALSKFKELYDPNNTSRSRVDDLGNNLLHRKILAGTTADLVVIIENLPKHKHLQQDASRANRAGHKPLELLLAHHGIAQGETPPKKTNKAWKKKKLVARMLLQYDAPDTCTKAPVALDGEDIQCPLSADRPMLEQLLDAQLINRNDLIKLKIDGESICTFAINSGNISLLALLAKHNGITKNDKKAYLERAKFSVEENIDFDSTGAIAEILGVPRVLSKKQKSQKREKANKKAQGRKSTKSVVDLTQTPTPQRAQTPTSQEVAAITTVINKPSAQNPTPSLVHTTTTNLSTVHIGTSTTSAFSKAPKPQQAPRPIQPSEKNYAAINPHEAEAFKSFLDATTLSAEDIKRILTEKMRDLEYTRPRSRSRQQQTPPRDQAFCSFDREVLCLGTDASISYDMAVYDVRKFFCIPKKNKKISTRGFTCMEYNEQLRNRFEVLDNPENFSLNTTENVPRCIPRSSPQRPPSRSLSCASSRSQSRASSRSAMSEEENHDLDLFHMFTRTADKAILSMGLAHRYKSKRDGISTTGTCVSAPGHIRINDALHFGFFQLSFAQNRCVHRWFRPYTEASTKHLKPWHLKSLKLFLETQYGSKLFSDAEREGILLNVIQELNTKTRR